MSRVEIEFRTKSLMIGKSNREWRRDMIARLERKRVKVSYRFWRNIAGMEDLEIGC